MPKINGIQIVDHVNLLTPKKNSLEPLIRKWKERFRIEGIIIHSTGNIESQNSGAKRKMEFNKFKRFDLPRNECNLKTSGGWIIK